MSGSWRLWMTFAGLVVLHFFLHLGLGLGPEAPDLLTVALLLAVREVGMGAGAALGFVLGLLEDAFSLLAFGANALAMTLVGAAGARTRDLFVGDSLLFLVSYFFFGKWARDAVYWVLVGEPLREPFVRAVLVHGTLTALYAAAAGVVAAVVGGVWRDSIR